MSNTSYWSQALGRRMSRRSYLAFTGAAAASAALLASCGGEQAQEEQVSGLVTQPVDTSQQARRGGVFKWFWKAEPPNFDPSFGSTNNRTPKNLTNSLLIQQKPGYLGPPRLGEVISDLAESWETSPDATELTFKLRQGVRWHNLPPVNGRLFDMEDMLFSWERLLRVNSHRARLANEINPEAPIVSVTAPDSTHVTFKLKEPYSAIMALLSNQVAGHMAIVPKETDSTLDLRARFLGTGPFMLTSADPSVRLDFKRNPDYFLKDRAFIDVLEMPIVPEYATQLAQFRAGGIYTIPVRKDDVLTQKREIPELNLVATDVTANSTKIAFGWLPEDKSPFLDKRVRQAFSMAWDRDLFIDAVGNVQEFGSQGLPIDTRWNSSIPSDFEGYWLDPKSKDFGDNAKYYQHDLQAAKQLLSAAGYPNGFDLVQTFTKSIGDENQRAILAEMAREAGFNVEARQVDVTTGYTPMRDSLGQFEGILVKSGGAIDDPIAEMSFHYSLRAGVNFYGFNASGKSAPAGDPFVESLIDKGLSEFDPEKRQAIAFELQRYLADQMYLVMYPGGSSGFTLAWPALRNFGVYRGNSDQIPATWWIDDSKAPIKNA